MIIQCNLNQNWQLKSIVKSIKKDSTTISKEVKDNLPAEGYYFMMNILIAYQELVQIETYHLKTVY